MIILSEAPTAIALEVIFLAIILTVPIDFIGSRLSPQLGISPKATVTNM